MVSVMVFYFDLDCTMLIVSHNTGWYENKIGYSFIHSLFVYEILWID